MVHPPRKQLARPTGVSAMQCKTGTDHLGSLQDGRAVYIDGKRVEDVTTHAAYRNSVASAALLYDYQARPENIELMTFLPEGGSRRARELLGSLCRRQAEERERRRHRIA